MATVVPSRFAVLAIDDDDSSTRKSRKSTAISKQHSISKNYKVKQQETHEKPPKKDKKKSDNKIKKKNNIQNLQWEQWKKKDSMAVEEAYQHELYQAMLQSKLSYESQHDNNVLHEDRNPKKNVGGNKKPKKATMSLVEFNNMTGMNDAAEKTASESERSRENKQKKSDAKFFDRLNEEMKATIIKNRERLILESRLSTKDDDITSAVLKVEIEKRDGEISMLQKEISSLKLELSQVKERNKKLYQILSHGEMKDKASVLAEVAKLQDIRDELTSEVSSLHAQLEQERSKIRTSNSDTTKPSRQNVSEK